MVEAFESLYNNDELVPFQQELHELNDRIINDLPSSKPLSFEGDKFESGTKNNTEKHETIKNKIISHLPSSRYLDSKYMHELLDNIDLSSDTTYTFMKQGSEQENYQIIYNAAKLIQDSGDTMTLPEALDKASYNRKISDILLDDTDNIDITNIGKMIFQIIDEGGDPFSGIIIPEKTRFTNEDILGKVKTENDQRVLYITELNPNQQEKIFKLIERRYDERFENSISSYLDKNQNANINTLYNNADLFELYVQYYNIQQLQTPGGKERTIDTKNLTPKKRQEINKHFNAQLKSMNYKVSDVDATLLKEKEERSRRIREENKRKLERIKELNKKRNDRILSRETPNKEQDIEPIQSKSIDTNNATGREIAANADLDLKDFDLDIKDPKENEQRPKEAGFRDAYNNFITSHNNIKEYITIEQMRRLFDINSNTINNIEREKFKEFNPLLKEMSQGEVTIIYNTLLGFPTYFTDAQKKLSSNSFELKEKVKDTVKTHAIGAVIDNVRDTFSIITEKQSGNSKGFQLDKNNPIKQDGNDIIISGLFNSSDVEIRYNLETGDLLMKSLLHKDEINPNKISIGERYDKIGTLEPFNNVLNNYYKLPSHPAYNDRISNGPQPGRRPGGEVGDHHKEPPQKGMEDNRVLPPNMPPRQAPMGTHPGSPVPRIDRDNINDRREEAKKLLNSQINLIDEITKNKTESMAQINLAINKFMKTFNIMPDSLGSTSLDFNKGSNLFDIIQIIDNTGNIKTGDIPSLEYFNNKFMPKIIEYSGLKWGERNEYQNKKTKKSEKLFEYNGDNESIKYLRDMTKDFNPTQFSGTYNFENSHQLGLANFIKETVIIGNSPNWRLNTGKMEEFINSLEEEFDDKVEKTNIELNSGLAKQINNM